MTSQSCDISLGIRAGRCCCCCCCCCVAKDKNTKLIECLFGKFISSGNLTNWIAVRISLSVPHMKRYMVRGATRNTGKPVISFRRDACMYRPTTKSVTWISLKIGQQLWKYIWKKRERRRRRRRRRRENRTRASEIQFSSPSSGQVNKFSQNGKF